MSKNIKINKLREVLGQAEEGKAELQIIRFQGVFKAILLKKHYKESDISWIVVKTLDNDNPDYEKNISLKIDLNDGGVSEIKVLKFN
tara:strand:- start:8730 stop:8990 length:261 start_codon:yes stop_codon:yes gene_type:complete